jgi:hypothetical protein
MSIYQHCQQCNSAYLGEHTCAEARRIAREERLRAQGFEDATELEAIRAMYPDVYRDKLLHMVDSLRDRPEFDGTDGAHPAWWRGHDDGAKGMAKLVEELRAKLAENDESFNAANEVYNSHLKELEAKLAEAEKVNLDLWRRRDDRTETVKGHWRGAQRRAENWKAAAKIFWTRWQQSGGMHLDAVERAEAAEARLR